MSYGKKCPECGAMLDPGEICDCQDSRPPRMTANDVKVKKADLQIKNDVKAPVTDSLILGVDMAADEDVPVISVARFNGSALVFVKCLVGDDARRIYKELTDSTAIKVLEPKPQKSTFEKEDH